MTDTNHLKLPLIAAAQAQKHVTHNEALAILDAAVQLAVESRAATAPPPSPPDGARYLVAASPTGAWSGRAGKIAVADSGGWTYLAPQAGWRAYVRDEDQFVAFDGTAWTPLVRRAAMFGVNADPDTTNRLSVSSPAVLFNHAGHDARIVVNKAAAADVGTLQFQTGFAAKAEIGLVGDDDLRVKIRDGGSLRQALVVKSGSGRVGIGVAEPGAELEVADSSGDNDCRIQLRADAGEVGQIGVTSTQMFIDTTNSKPFVIYTTYDETVVIDDLKQGEHYGESDAFVPSLDPTSSGTSLVDRVMALPVQARDAARSAFNKTIERVVVMRLDQLGDLSASMPAIRRLREMFPKAHFEGVVTPINAYLLKSSGLFDEIVTVDFTYDHGTRRRWLGRAAHGDLKKRFAEPVDVAIDLSPGEDSRPVLALINARYRAGFKPHRFGFLDFGIDLLTRDPVNRKEAVSHTAMISAFVEALAVMLRPPPPRFPPAADLARHLAPFDLQPQDYIAIHSGARLAIKRWPLAHYIALAGLLRAETGRRIVMFADDPLTDQESQTIEAIGGVQTLVGRTDFETLDALISFAALFVGNDTGPKHLAAMRGVKTVSVHMGQVNWNEWGQDGDGLIVSKRVPCCGCGIEDPTECGKGMVCLDGLAPRDVADAVKRALRV